MNIENLLEYLGVGLLSLGGAGAIILPLAGWLGKLWAERFMKQEAARFDKELAKLTADLQIRIEHLSQVYKQKIELYREVSNPIVELIIKKHHVGVLTEDDLKEFDKTRLSTTALLAMFAPTNVFDEYNNVIDYIYDTCEGKKTWSFTDFRCHALKFLSLVRADVGLYKDEISYKGVR